MAGYDMVNDFWDRLPVEWKDGRMQRIADGAGRTDEQLDALERAAGFTLPALFREQYKVQNGGYPKRAYFKDDGPPTEAGANWRNEDGSYAIFINDSHLPQLTGDYYSFREYLRNIWNDEEIAERFPDWDIDRLVIISPMWGHSTLCLDYGYRKGTSYAEPQVVCMGDEDFKEILRVAGYEQFVAGLVMREPE